MTVPGFLQGTAENRNNFPVYYIHHETTFGVCWYYNSESRATIASISFLPPLIALTDRLPWCGHGS